jgi:exodeoxyribonuclease VII large subunit
VRRAVRYQMMLARQRFTALSFAQIQGRLHALIGRRGQRLDDLSRRLELAGRRCVQERAGRMTLLDARLARQSPAAGLAVFRRRLEAAQQTLGRLAVASTAAQRTRLSHASARLHALSPVAVLSRGYALVYAADGRLLRSAEGVLPGETVRARLGRGSIAATVETVDAE